MGDDVPAVAQDGGGIADLVNLVYAMSHGEDGGAAVAEIADDLKEPERFLGG